MAKRKKRSGGKRTSAANATKPTREGEPSAAAPLNPPQRHWPLLIGSAALLSVWLVVLALLVWQRLQG